MEEKYIELLAKTDYDALTVDEKEMLQELCTNQSEFEEAKELMKELSALDSEPDLFDSHKLKKRLDEDFAELYSSRGGGDWINFLFPPLKPIMNRPGIQMAMVIVLFLGSYLLLELIDFNNTKTVKLAKSENKLLIEDEEESIDLEIDENSMFDEKNMDEKVLENSELAVELILTPEVGLPLDSQETSLVIDNLLPEESIEVGTIQEGITTLEFEASRPDLKASKDNITETNKFLIPTVQESPDLLEGLFVTF